MRKARETRSSKYEGKTDLDGGGNARGEGYCDSRRLFRESERVAVVRQEKQLEIERHSYYLL